MGWFDGWFSSDQPVYQTPPYLPQGGNQSSPQFDINQYIKNAQRQQFFNGLMQTGGNLIAAGQPMYGFQRAQILANAANEAGRAFNPMAPYQMAIGALQAQKLNQDIQQQEAWQKAFGFPGGTPAQGQPTASPAASVLPSAGPMPGSVPPNASPMGGNSAVNILSRLDPQTRAFIGAMGPERGGAFLSALAAKQLETGQWEPFSGPQNVPMQRNRFTGEIKPLDPTLSKVTVNPSMSLPPQETEEQKKVGAYYGDIFGKLQDAGRDAQTTKAKLGQIGDLLDNVYTGTGAQTVQDVKRAAQAFGVQLDTPANIGAADAATALSREIALQLRNPAGGAGMPGSLSDSDRRYLESMTPGLSQTTEGRKLLIGARSKIAERDMDVAKLARDYRQKNGKIDEGFFNQLQQYSDSHPLFAGLSLPAPVPAGNSGGWSIRPVQ